VAVRALLALGLLATCNLATSRADDRLDSEGQLVQRRAAHLARLPPPPSAPQVSLPTFNAIDQFIAAGWIAAGLESATQLAELSDPTMPGRHGAATQDILAVRYSIEYERNEQHAVTVQTAANVAQVFLRTTMTCASCHDHFENREWTQDRFLGFGGLFAAGH